MTLNDLLTFYSELQRLWVAGSRRLKSWPRKSLGEIPQKGHHALARIEAKRQEFDAAQHHLRLALAVDPENPRRAMDLAVLLGEMSRFVVSDSMFDLAAILSPDWPELDFRRASSYVMERRNLEQARQLLQRCLRSQLTPEDPPREEAEALLKKVSGSYVRHPIQSTLAPEPSNFN